MYERKHLRWYLRARVRGHPRLLSGRCHCSATVTSSPYKPDRNRACFVQRQSIPLTKPISLWGETPAWRCRRPRSRRDWVVSGRPCLLFSSSRCDCSAGRCAAYRGFVSARSATAASHCVQVTWAATSRQRRCLLAAVLRCFIGVGARPEEGRKPPPPALCLHNNKHTASHVFAPRHTQRAIC
jgi:hypothetical protein